MYEPLEPDFHPKGVTHRYRVTTPLVLYGTESIRPLRPGDILTVSVIYDAPDHHRPETAVIHNHDYLAVYRGLSSPTSALTACLLTPKRALLTSELLLNEAWNAVERKETAIAQDLINEAADLVKAVHSLL